MRSCATVLIFRWSHHDATGQLAKIMSLSMLKVDSECKSDLLILEIFADSNPIEAVYQMQSI